MSGKKVFGVILGICMVLGLSFGVLCFFYPEMLGIGEENENVEVMTAEQIHEEEALGEVSRELPVEPSEEASRELDMAESMAQASREAELNAIRESEEAASREAESKAAKESEEAASREAESKAAKESAEKASREAESKAAESKAAEASKTAEAKASSEAAASSVSQGSGSVDGLVDQKAPVFLVFNSAPEVKVGADFDIHKYVGYADDVDRDVAIDVSGSVDTSRTGTYSLKITLTDDAGHKTAKDMNVKVVKSTSSGGSSGGKKEQFSDFVKNYKTDQTSLGIDVSRWQETIDFEKVKAAGCEFVIMRLGGLDDGELYTDRYYQANMSNAKAAGLKIGIYWHAEESSREEIKASVDYLLGVLGSNTLDFPIAYDWEDYKNFERYGMNLHDLTNCFYAFAEELQARGYSACLYGSKNSHENIWMNDRKLPVWLAHYTSATSYGGDYYMWQHSSTGRIDGINGDVDLDVLYLNRLP